MSSAAWVMESLARWTAALRAARLGRLLGGRRRKITSLPPPLSAWTGTRDVPPCPRPSPSATRAKRERARRRSLRARRAQARPRAGKEGAPGRAREEVPGPGPGRPDRRCPAPGGQELPETSEDPPALAGEWLLELVDRLVDYRALARSAAPRRWSRPRSWPP